MWPASLTNRTGRARQLMNRLVPDYPILPGPYSLWSDLWSDVLPTLSKPVGTAVREKTKLPTADTEIKNHLTVQDNYVIADDIRHVGTEATRKANAKIWEYVQWGGWFTLAVLACLVCVYFLLKYKKYFKKVVRNTTVPASAASVTSTRPLCLLQPYNSRTSQNIYFL